MVRGVACVMQIMVSIFTSINLIYNTVGASQVGVVVKNLPANAGDVKDASLIPRSGRSSWKKEWQPTLVFLPGESHEQRILVGYSPYVHRESDAT